MPTSKLLKFPNGKKLVIVKEEKSVKDAGNKSRAPTLSLVLLDYNLV